MNKIYIKLTPGFANQLYEYMAAYALARKLSRELVLDISLCRDSEDAYLLDMLCIPKHKKIWYSLPDAQHRLHPSAEDIPISLREESVIFSDMDLKLDNFYFYLGLNNISSEEIPENKDVFMCGWFFPRKYYEAYWDELCEFCKLKEDTEQLSLFRKKTDGKETVGVHIRRGDFCTGAMSANLVSDDFWRAALVWFRKRYKACVFCVFSDDIEYARGILGNAEDIFYVHFGNGGSAAISEFLCLSSCKHKILSNGSTFSDLATAINSQAASVVLRFDKNFHSYRWSSKVRLTLKKLLWQYQRKAVKSKEIGFNDADVRIFSKKYNLIQYDEVLGQSLDHNSELHYFFHFIENEKYDLALDLAYCNYTKWKHDQIFQKDLVSALLKTGNCEEAVVEAVAAGVAVENDSHLYQQLMCEEPIHFVIVPYYKSYASSKTVELVHLGIILWHLGHKVSLVMEPINDDEEKYMKKNHILTTRRYVPLGPEQYVWKDAIEQGIEGFLSQISCQGERLIVIARRAEFLEQHLAPVIFPDYSSEFDAERLGGGRR